MEKKRWMRVGGALAAVVGVMMPPSAWAAWGMKEEPNAPASTGSARAEASSGRTEAAVPAAPAAPDFKTVEDLAKEDTGFAMDMYRLAGERYLNRNKPAQAVQVFTQALKLAPADTQLMEGLAGAQFAAGQKKEAAATWDGILANHHDIGFQLRYASFLEKIGEGAKSIEIVRAQAATRPDDSSLHYGIADAYQRQGKPAEGVKELQAMLKAFPKEEVEIKRRIAALQPAPKQETPAPKQEAPAKQPPAAEVKPEQTGSKKK